MSITRQNKKRRMDKVTHSELMDMSILINGLSLILFSTGWHFDGDKESQATLLRTCEGLSERLSNELETICEGVV